MTAYSSNDQARDTAAATGWRRTARRFRGNVRRWLHAPTLTERAPSGATAWLLYHPPGVIRVVTPAESAALDRVRHSPRR